MDRRRSKKLNDAQILIQDNITLRTINADLRVEVEQRLMEAYQERDHFLATVHALENQNRDLRRSLEFEQTVRLHVISIADIYKAECATNETEA